MGWKRKLVLLAIVAALIGYIQYFNVEFNTDVILITVGIAFMLLMSFFEEMDTYGRTRPIRNKVILVLILVGEIFYIWYFKVQVSSTIIGLLVLLVMAFGMAIMSPTSTPQGAYRGNRI